MQCPFATKQLLSCRSFPSWPRTTFFFILFFLVFFKAVGQDPQNQVPEYEHINSERLSTVNFSFSGFPPSVSANTEDAIIAIDTDLEGNVYALSFGNGLEKRDSEGKNPQTLISGNKLDNPLDLAVDENGLIYIADYLAQGSCSDNGKIRVFDTNGNELQERRILTSFYRPLGISLDQDNNLYVAEYNRGGGCESDELSRVRKYNTESGQVLNSTSNVDIPYRIAVDSQNKVYVSQAGNDNPQVLVFNSELVLQGNLPDIQSPGSIVVDDFDFIHVTEYAGRVNFERFLNYEDLSSSEAQRIARDIYEGSRNGEFSIKIFDANQTLQKTFKTELHFPVDLAFSSCDRMYVNDAEVFGGSLPFIGFMPEKIEFDLEIYERTPSFDIEDPVAVCVDPGLEFALEDGEVTISVEDIDAGSTDNCGIASMELSQYTFTTPGDKEITLTVTDEVGNTAECTTTIEITGDEDEPTPPEADCDDFTVALDETGQAQITAEQVYGGEEDLDLEIDISEFSCADLGENEVKLTVTDRETGLSDTCTAIITVIDDSPPVLSCPGDQNESFDPETGFEVPDYRGEAEISDNCDSREDLAITQDPDPGEIIFESTPVTIIVEDGSGNSSNCEFQLNLEEEPEEVEISCPGNQTASRDEICEFELEDYTSLATANEGAEISQSPEPGTVVSEETTITLTATLNGESDSCDFQVVLEDNAAPVLSCPGDQNESFDPETGFEVPDYRGEAEISDNCDSREDLAITQDPEPGEVIFESTRVIIFAEDSSGNSSNCEFQLNLEEEPEEVEISCPGNQTASLDENCEFELEDYTSLATANEGAEISQSPEPGTVVSEETTITLTAMLNGESDSCDLQLVLEDNSAPVLSCPDNQNESFDPEAGFQVPDYRGEAEISDNCDSREDLTITQDPEPGEIIYESTPVIIFAEDSSGNSSNCEFQLNLEEEEPQTGPVAISCLQDITQTTDTGECGAVVEFDTPEASDENGSVEVIQTEGPASGEFFPVGETEVVFEATGSDGDTVNCRFTVTVTDDEDPVISCPDDMTIEIPVFRDSAIVEFEDPGFLDNCEGASLEQTGGTRSGENFTEGTTTVEYTATDASGNKTVCRFTVLIVREGTVTPPQFENCPDDITAVNDPEGCGAVVNFSAPELVEANRGVQVNRIDDGPEPGELFSIGETVVRYQADDGVNEPVECSFTVSVSDTEEPLISCPGDQTEHGEPGAGFEVPDYRNLPDASDNCEIGEIEQVPAQGEVIYEDTEISIIVSDASGNFSECSFMLHLSEEEVLEITCPGDQNGQLDENCQFEVPDYTGLAEVNFENASISQSPEPGEIIEESTSVSLSVEANGQTDSCSFALELSEEIPPVANCVEEFTLTLGSNGRASLTPEDIDRNSTDNCRIDEISIDKTEFTTSDLGENTVTLTVTDAFGNTDSCVTRVLVEEEQTSPGFQCRESIALELDEEGRAQLQITDLYTGNADGYNLEVSQLEFDCSDLGETIVNLNYTGASSGSCSIRVNIFDDIRPVAEVRIVSLVLNVQGFVEISPEDVDDGSYDNCGELDYSLNKTRFTCKDIGMNSIEFTVTDDSGNTTTLNSLVYVNATPGVCSEPEEDYEYIFIYPNPSSGQFNVSMPRDVVLHRVEVYDNRGRFIAEKDFHENSVVYTMELEGVQNAIYVLKLFTNDGEDIRRLIINN